MSFPAHDKREIIYRNDITIVARFFDTRHPDAYQIYNMSNREVKAEKFAGEVISYEWADHHSPALSLLFKSCAHMCEYLKQDSR